MIYEVNFVNICMSDILAYVECFVCHCVALRWGVTQVGNSTTGHCSPRRGTPLFQVPKTHLGRGRIRGLKGEEMAKLALSCIFFFFVKFWARDPVLYKL